MIYDLFVKKDGVWVQQAFGGMSGIIQRASELLAKGQAVKISPQ